jgi:hypothetical protein
VDLISCDVRADKYRRNEPRETRMTSDTSPGTQTVMPAFIAARREHRATNFPYQNLSPDATTVTMPELHCEFPDGPEAWSV